MLVVHLLWEQADWVRFPAARQDAECKLFCVRWESKGFYLRRRRRKSPGFSEEKTDSQQLDR